jgi:hypothetical protein
LSSHIQKWKEKRKFMMFFALLFVIKRYFWRVDRGGPRQSASGRSMHATNEDRGRTPEAEAAH